MSERSIDRPAFRKLLAAASQARRVLYMHYLDEVAERRKGMYSKTWRALDAAIRKAEGKQ